MGMTDAFGRDGTATMIRQFFVDDTSSSPSSLEDQLIEIKAAKNRICSENSKWCDSVAYVDYSRPAKKVGG